MSAPSAPLIVVRPRATNQSLEFYWAPPSSDGGSAITGYVLADAGHSLSYNLGASTYYHQVTGLTNGETYSFTLAATNGNGTGPTAAFRSVQPGNKPTPPTNVTASLGTSTAIVNWALPTNNSGASLIRNLVEAVPINEAGAEQRTSTIYGTTYGNGTARFVSPLGSYTYKIYVHSINDPGWSARSQGITLANGAFVPNDISGSLALWVDMADTTTYDVSGLYIPYIRDKSFSTVTFKGLPGTGGTGHDFIAGFTLAGDTNQSLRISADGENWGTIDGQQNPTGNKCAAVLNVKYNGSNLWMVGGNFADNTACIETSSNGYDWSTMTQAFTGATSFVRGLVHGGGTKWVAGGQNAGDPPSTLQYSLDNGSNWTLAGCGINYVTDIAWDGNSTFVAVGYDFLGANEGQFATSVDGITWSAAQYTPQSNRFYPLVVKYLGGNWYMGGVDGVDATSNLWRSSDGSNWSNVNHGQLVTQTIAYNGSNLYVLGGNSYGNYTQTMKYSTDGVTWSNWVTQNYLFICQGVTYANGKWVAVGYSQYDYLGAKLGVYMYSYDGSNWIPGAGIGTGNCVEASSSNGNIITPSSFAEFPHIGSTINGKATAGFTKAATTAQQFISAEGTFDARTGNFGSLFWVGRQSAETPYQSLFGTAYNYDWNTRSNFYVSNINYPDNLLAAPHANPVYMFRNESTIAYSAYSNVDVAPSNSLYMTSATGFVYPTAANGWDKLGLYTRLQGLAFESAVWDRGWTGDLAEIIALKQQTPAPLAQKVEGYLAWKWGLVNSLPSNHPYKTAAPGQTFDQGPTRLGNTWAALRNGNSYPMFWYDGADATTITVDGNSNLLTWGDKSGLGATLKPATAWSPDPNGSVQFRGYGVYFSTTSNNQINGYAPPGPQPQYIASNVTQFFVCSPSANPSGTQYITLRPGAPGGSPAWIANLAGSESTMTLYNFGTTVSSLTSTMLLSYTGEDFGQLQQFFNGSNVFSGPLGDTNGGQQYRSNAFNIGTDSGLSGFDGYAYEWLQYPFALTKPERQYVEGCLAWKWNFASNLPAGHPYKSAAPTAPPTWSSNSFESASLRLWLDASDPFGNGVPPTVGSTIMTWYDKSGSGNHAGAAAPFSTFCSSILTPYIEFRNSNYFHLSNASTYMVSTPYTIFTVETAEDVVNYPYNWFSNPIKYQGLLGTQSSSNMTMFVESRNGMRWHEEISGTRVFTAPNGPFFGGEFFGFRGNGHSTIMLAVSAPELTLYRSPDNGNTWSSPISFGSRPLNRASFAYSPTLSLWVAVGSGANQTAWSADDGSNWTGAGSATTILEGVEWGSDRFMAFGGYNNNIEGLQYSTDGSNWTICSAAITAFSITRVLDVAYGNSNWVAVIPDGAGSTNFIYSTDGGSNWSEATTATSTIAGNSFNPKSVCWNGNRFVAVGAGANMKVITSPDGNTWTSSAGGSNFTPGTGFNRVRSDLSGMLVALRATNTNPQYAYSTDNGSNWTLGSGSTVAPLSNSVFNMSDTPGPFRLSYANGRWYGGIGYLQSGADGNIVNFGYQYGALFGGGPIGPFAGKQSDGNGLIVANISKGLPNIPKITTYSFKDGTTYLIGTQNSNAYGQRGGGYAAITDVSDLCLGASFLKSAFYNGKFHEARIYKGNMSQSEIQEIYNELYRKWGGRGTSNTTIGATTTLSNIRGISLWLDATDPFGDGSVPPNGSSIGVWRDKSGNSRHATCVTPNYAKYKTLSNDRWIQFEGNNTPEVYVVSTTSFFNSTPVTYFLADTYQGGTASNLGTVAFGSIRPDGNAFRAVYDTATGGGGVNLAITNTAGGNLVPTLAENVEPGRTHIWTFSKTQNLYGDYSGRVFENGKLVGSNTTATLQAIDDSNVFSIGGGYQTGSNDISTSYHGKMRELVAIQGNVDDATRQQVEQYLINKWNPPLYATSPLDVSGLRVWLDGADPAGTGTRPADGSLLTTWVDKSGLSNSFTGTAKPIYHNRGANQYVEFSDLSSTKLSLANPTFLNGKYFTIFVVEEYDGLADPLAAPFGAAWFLGNDAGNLTLGYYTYPVGPESPFGPIAIYVFDINTAGLIANGLTKKIRRLWIFQMTPRDLNTNIANTMRTWMYEGNQGSRVNPPNTYQITSQGAPLGALSNVSVGAGYWNSYSTETYYKGKIFEVLFYEGELPGDDRVKIKNYLLKKWSIFNANPTGLGPMSY